MKCSFKAHILTAVSLCLLLSPLSAAQKKLPNVLILATGGTIAGAQTSTKEVGYKSGSFDVNDLISAVPTLKDLANLSGEQIASIGSQTMNHEVWLKLAKRINEALKGNVDGIVITHGTDTMEETAYFLSLVVKSDKPVVLVGSMRPATAISADGPMNLYNAVALAASPEAKGRGALVVLNDEIHYARESEKTNTTSLDTFKSPNRGRAGVMNTGNIHFFYPNSNVRHTMRSEFSVEGKTEKDLPRVEIVYSHANYGREVIDYLAQSGVKGIVLAGVGDGNATDAAMAGLSDAAKQGVAVVRSSRVGSGLVVRNVECNDDQLGLIAAMELNPQKARVLLMLGLMNTKDPRKLQNYFTEY